jgi:hypothetical protein
VPIVDIARNRYASIFISSNPLKMQCFGLH